MGLFLSETDAIHSARTARAMRSAQAAYDSQAEPECDAADDSETLTENEAFENAESLVLERGYALAAALKVLCCDDGAPPLHVTPVPELCYGGYDAQDKTPRELLAVLINGDSISALAARAELRERLKLALAPQVRALADEFLAAT